MTEEKDGKFFIRRAVEEVDKLWKPIGTNFDTAYDWIKSRPDLWNPITEAELEMNNACNAGEPPNRVRQWAVKWYLSWRTAIGYATRHLMTKEG